MAARHILRVETYIPDRDILIGILVFETVPVVGETRNGYVMLCVAMGQYALLVGSETSRKIDFLADPLQLNQDIRKPGLVLIQNLLGPIRSQN